MKRVTKRIGGICVTLKPGVRYIAMRPMADRKLTAYPVTIWFWTRIGQRMRVARVFGGLGYADADRFVNAFNNGTMSFDGRVW